MDANGLIDENSSMDWEGIYEPILSNPVDKKLLI